MVLKHDGIIMAKDIIEFPEGTDGFDLTDKSEKITDTEIFFDKADDSVVHVEVDGKSYQHAGSGKNLLNVKTYKGRIIHTTGEETLDESSSMILSDFIKVKPDTKYRLSREYSESNSHLGRYFYNKNKEYINGVYGFLDRNSIPIDTSVDAEYVKVSYNINDTFVQLEEGSTATEYEPPAPTPDYPIEIHSLNDVDVMSSVRRRNFILNSDLSLETSGMRSFDVSKDLTSELANKYGITLSVDVEVKNHKKLSNYNFNRIGFELKTITKSGKSAYRQVDIYPEDGETFKGRIYKYYRLDDVESIDGAIMWIQTGGDKVYVGNPKISLGDTENKENEWTPALEDITESDNHPLIDKINLLLDEPLRNVGNVKDRLFRDSDGLWKVERNVGEATFDGTEDWRVWYIRGTSAMFGLTSRNLEEPMLKTNGLIVSNMFPSMIVNTLDEEGIHAGTEPRLRVRAFCERIGTTPDSTDAQKINSFKQWLNNIYTEGVPFTTVYEVESPITETLDQELQDKLNNLRSFQDSNYVYTIINDETDILPDYVTNNLKPTLHARFKSEDYGILNNHYSINYPDKITYLGTYFKHGDLVTQEFIESED